MFLLGITGILITIGGALEDSIPVSLIGVAFVIYATGIGISIEIGKLAKSLDKNKTK